MATPTTTKTGKTGKTSRTSKVKGKTTKPSHPGPGKATSSNANRVMTSPKPKAVSGSDGRKHTVGRFRMGVSAK